MFHARTSRSFGLRPQVTTALVLALVLWVSAAPATAQAADPVAGLVEQLRLAVAGGRPDALEPLVAADAARASIDAFSKQWVTPPTTRVTLKERDRSEAEGSVRVAADVFVEAGVTGRFATWQIDLRRDAHGALLISSLRTISSVDGIHRLALDATRQFQATNLHVTAEDFDLSLPHGTVFFAEVPGGPTAAVLLGRGEMVFKPAPETERGQVRLFAGDETLRTPFDAAFVRVPPSELATHLDSAALQAIPVDPEALRDAQEVFTEEVGKSFGVDLSEFTAESWSLLPTPTDFLAEVRTRRFGTLTYARASNQPEDITLFDREHRHNISVYASKERLATQGPFYNEDDEADYDVLDYNVDVSFTPERQWFDGHARLKLRVRSYALASLTLRLSSAFTVRSVTRDRDRLLFLRVRNQDSLVVNLPSQMSRGDEITLTVSYYGHLEPQSLDREAVEVGQIFQREETIIEPEPSYLYSNRSYWYPQSMVSDYGTSLIRMAVPRGYAAVCTGEAAAGSPVTIKLGAEPRQLYVFGASQPVRYLGCVVSRLVPGESRSVAIPGGTVTSVQTAEAGRRYNELKLETRANPRQRGRTGDLVSRAADIAHFYGSLMHDTPYPSLTLTVIESLLPGGHSPPYVAELLVPMPSSPYVWRDDPASFQNYPEFFLAHEVAHQWWGHGVGGRNYHEQWLSEGFAQYFAALYAQKHRGPDVFAGIIRSMNRWAVNTSDQGPVYLGYRLGHVRGDPRILRAIIYNKGAMVLHMLRRLTGDEAFFAGLRRFYEDNRFHKAGTDGLRLAFEAETGQSFERFFERWIYESNLPTLTWTTRTEGAGADQALVIHFEQGERIFDFPVTVSLQLADGTTVDVIVPITDRIVERRLPFKGQLRSVRVNRDKGALLRDEG